MEQVLDKSVFVNGVIVFGAGNIGKMTVFLLRNSGFSRVHCFDNDSSK